MKLDVKIGLAPSATLLQVEILFPPFLLMSCF